jgi:hypothetical protein
MKTTILTALLLSAASANAGQCVALDYQEMKEMSLADLSIEYCRAHAEASKNLTDGISDLNRPRAKAPSGADDNFDGCMNQIKRIERLLAQKGIEKPTVDSLCKAAPNPT